MPVEDAYELITKAGRIAEKQGAQILSAVLMRPISIQVPSTFSNTATKSSFFAHPFKIESITAREPQHSTRAMWRIADDPPTSSINC
jgi:hypothetical protein